MTHPSKSPAMTVAELREALEGYADDTPVHFLERLAQYNIFVPIVDLTPHKMAFLEDAGMFIQTTTRGNNVIVLETS